MELIKKILTNVWVPASIAGGAEFIDHIVDKRAATAIAVEEARNNLLSRAREQGIAITPIKLDPVGQSNGDCSGAITGGILFTARHCFYDAPGEEGRKEDRKFEIFDAKGQSLGIVDSDLFVVDRSDFAYAVLANETSCVRAPHLGEAAWSVHWRGGDMYPVTSTFKVGEKIDDEVIRLEGRTKKFEGTYQIEALQGYQPSPGSSGAVVVAMTDSCIIGVITGASRPFFENGEIIGEKKIVFSPPSGVFTQRGGEAGRQ